MPKADKKGNTINLRQDLFIAVLTCLLIACVIPSFCNIGNLKIQILSPIILSAVISWITMMIKNGLKSMAVTLNIFLIMMVFTAFCYQIYLQIYNILNGGSFKSWIYMFYYDKPLSVGLVWLTAMVLYTIVRIIRGDNNKGGYLDAYENFFNFSSRGFIIYYTALLIYCFILIRGIDSSSLPANFIPFRNIIGYYHSIHTNGYEIFMMFFGNLLFFTPMGFYTKVIKPNKNIIFLLLFPVIISSAIELSQLVLKSGNCDIDDVLLNSIGFYFGVMFKNIMDFVINKRTGGRTKTIFNWKPSFLFYQKAP